MILQELTRCYDRMLEAGEAPEFGFGMQKMHWLITIDEAGNRIGDPAPLTEPEKGKILPVEREVPDPVTRSSGVAANFAWDNTAYVLGADLKGKPERALKCFAAFKARCHDIGGTLDDAGMRALLAFLDKWNPQDAPGLPEWDKIAGLNIVFRLAGEQRYIHDRAAVRAAWSECVRSEASDTTADCLVTGERGPVARLHSKVKGVPGAQTSGASLVSFNLESFISYEKKQNFNAPIGEHAAFAYATALNRLLARNSRRKVTIGKNVFVFWADGDGGTATESANEPENVFSMAFNESAKETADVEKLRKCFEAVRNGQPPSEAWIPDKKFFVLGLGPNAARVAVRYWLSSTVQEVFDRVRQHYEALAIVRRFDNEPEFPSLWQLLMRTKGPGTNDQIKPPLIDAFMRSILNGSDYPRSLQGAVLTRIRAERKVDYLRAALLKAFMMRVFHNRETHPDRMELTMTVNKETDNIAYRLGRLFAVLESTQRTARPGVNATLAERYLSAASNSPRAIFNMLLRKVQNDLKIIGREQGGGLAHWFRQQIADISAGLDIFKPQAEGVPARFTPDQTSLFLVGYYQQYAEKKDKSGTKAES